MKKTIILLISLLVITIAIIVVLKSFITQENEVSVHIDKIEVVSDDEIKDYYEDEFLLRRFFYYLGKHKNNYIPIKIDFSAQTDSESDSKYTTAFISSKDTAFYDPIPYNISESPIEFEKHIPCKFYIYAYVKQEKNSASIKKRVKEHIEIIIK